MPEFKDKAHVLAWQQGFRIGQREFFRALMRRDEIDLPRKWKHEIVSYHDTFVHDIPGLMDETIGE